MDVSPKQIVSVGTALIPFLEHDDANRASMGANMQKQAVPLVRAEAPYIGTGIEDRVARDSADLIQASGDGEVTEVSGSSITVTVQDGQRWPAGRQAGLSAQQVPPQQPGHLHQPPGSGEGRRQGREGHDHRRRSFDRSRRAGARQEPAGRPDAVGGLQLRGRDHPQRASRQGRRADVDPHPRARGRRPRHQVGPRGDLPRHPQPQRRHPPRPRRPWHHPCRRRSRPRRRAGRQGHPEGRDRADSGRAPAARHLRREGPRSARHLTEGAARRERQGHRRQGLHP